MSHLESMSPSRARRLRNAGTKRRIWHEMTCATAHDGFSVLQMLQGLHSHLHQASIYVPIYIPHAVSDQSIFQGPACPAAQRTPNVFTDLKTDVVANGDIDAVDVECSGDHMSCEHPIKTVDMLPMTIELATSIACSDVSPRAEEKASDNELPSEDLHARAAPCAGPSTALPPSAVAELGRALCSLTGLRRSIAITRLNQISTSSSTDLAELLSGVAQLELLEFIGVVSRLIDKEQSSESAVT